MRVLQSIWSLASENGGPTRSTIGLSKALGRAGVQVLLVSHVPGKVSQLVKDDLQSCGVAVREGRGNGFIVALRDAANLLEDCKPDIVHIQGLWKMSTHAMFVVAARHDIPVIISPRGMLDPWALSVKKWKKRLGLLAYQKNDLAKASAFHAASEAEAEHIRAFCLMQPIITVPNGVTLPDKMPERQSADKGRVRTALFLSRFHPGKGLKLLADSWAMLRPKGWRMMAVGMNENGYAGEIKEYVNKLGIGADWTFMDEVDDTTKWSVYRSADLFIHPSASENFGLSIAEALAAGIPVITTKGCPWAEIQGRCGWWIDRNVDSLLMAMQEAMSLKDEERLTMGKAGQQLILDGYSWRAIAQKMRDGYFNVLKEKGLT